jgi:hypothetical protein
MTKLPNPALNIFFMKCLLLSSGKLDVEEITRIAVQKKSREKQRKRDKPTIPDSNPDDPKEKARKKILKSYKIPKKGVATSLVEAKQVESKKVSKEVEINKDETLEDLEQDSDDQVDLHHNETFSDEEEAVKVDEKTKKTQDDSATPASVEAYNDDEAMPEVPPFPAETTFMPEGHPVATETTIPLNRELQFVDGKKFR